MMRQEKIVSARITNFAGSASECRGAVTEMRIDLPDGQSNHSFLDDEFSRARPFARKTKRLTASYQLLVSGMMSCSGKRN
ncbi:MAG: hypothetical protein WA418_12170 [Bradyrhizobium sp.]